MPTIRGELEISPKAIPDQALRRLWAALDEDGSGFLTAGELGHFNLSLPLTLSLTLSSNPSPNSSPNTSPNPNPNPNPNQVRMLLDAGVESADIGVVYLIRLYIAAFSILAVLLTLIAAAPYTFGLPYMFQVKHITATGWEA